MSSVKAKAVQAYKSQLPLLRGLMDSFVRTNELFATVDNVALPLVAKGNPLDPSTLDRCERASHSACGARPGGRFLHASSRARRGPGGRLSCPGYIQQALDVYASTRRGFHRIDLSPALEGPGFELEYYHMQHGLAQNNPGGKKPPVPGYIVVPRSAWPNLATPGRSLWARTWKGQGGSWTRPAGNWFLLTRSHDDAE